MKVLQINKYHYIKGGADSVFFNTCDLLRKNGYDVVEFCTKHPKNTFSAFDAYFVDAPEIRDLNFFGKMKGLSRFFYNRRSAKQLERLIVNEKPDIAHIHNLFNGLSLSILPILKAYHIPVAITMHDTRFICPSSYFNLREPYCSNCLKKGGLNCGLHRCYQDSFLNSWMCALEMFHKEYLFDYDSLIDKYIFVSNRYLSFHKDRHPYFGTKGEVLYNFLPGLNQIGPNSKKGDYLLYYGRVTVEKGIRTLVEVMRDLPHIQLKVAGTGPLLDELKGLGLKNVEFLGFLKGDALFDCVKNSSFVVVPSEWEENNPLTVIEAYAYGKPVIGSRIGGIPEIVREDTGFLFDAFDKKGLSEAIQHAHQITDSQYTDMSSSARQFANTHFNDQIHYTHLLKIYKDIIANS